MPRNLVTPPDIFPVTLGEIKEHLGILITDTTFDVLLSQIIREATNQVETDFSRAIVEQEWVYYFPAFPPVDEPFRIPLGSLRSITSIEYRDADGAWQTVSSSVYEILTYYVLGEVYLKVNETWGYIEAGDTLYPRDAVRITAKVGYCGLVQSVMADTGTSETKIVFPDVHNLRTNDAIVNTTRRTKAVNVYLDSPDITDLTLDVFLRESVVAQASGDTINSYDLSSIPGQIIRALKFLIAHNFENREPVLATAGAFAIEIPLTYQRLLSRRINNV